MKKNNENNESVKSETKFLDELFKKELAQVGEYKKVVSKKIADMEKNYGQEKNVSKDEEVCKDKEQENELASKTDMKLNRLHLVGQFLCE